MMWLTEEFERAAERTRLLPPHARVVVTRAGRPKRYVIANCPDYGVTFDPNAGQRT